MINKEETDYTLMLITLEGCQGCNIMFSNVVEAINKSRKPIEFKHIKLAKNTIKNNKDVLNKYDIRDYPAVLFFNKDNLKYKYIGTMPITVILRWIDIHFK